MAERTGISRRDGFSPTCWRDRARRRAGLHRSQCRARADRAQAPGLAGILPRLEPAAHTAVETTNRSARRADMTRPTPGLVVRRFDPARFSSGPAARLRQAGSLSAIGSGAALRTMKAGSPPGSVGAST